MTDWSGFTIPQLVLELNQRGIRFTSTRRKSELIALLVEYDEFFRHTLRPLMSRGVSARGYPSSRGDYIKCTVSWYKSWTEPTSLKISVYGASKNMFLRVHQVTPTSLICHFGQQFTIQTVSVDLVRRREQIAREAAPERGIYSVQIDSTVEVPPTPGDKEITLAIPIPRTALTTAIWLKINMREYLEILKYRYLLSPYYYREIVDLITSYL